MCCPTYLPCVAIQCKRGCNQLMALTGPNNRLQAMTSIARKPRKNVSKIYELFQKAYPFEKTQLGNTTTTTYLLFKPKTFSLSLAFDGGGALALDKLMFDNKGNLWSRAN